MAKTITITEKQQVQFNRMLEALTAIHKSYESTEKLRRNSEKNWGLDFEEAIEMAYENIQLLAKTASKGVKFLQ